MVARVTVYDERIASAFFPGRPIFEEVRRIGKQNLEAARHYVPVRTGRTKASITFSVTPSGKYHCRYSLGPNVDYALYVLNGTTGPIFANSGMLWVRPRPYSRFPWRPQFKTHGGRTPLFWVNGQKQNDWLGKSFAFTLAKNRLR